MIELTAAQLAEADVSPREVFDFYRERAANDELGAFLWVAEEAPAESAAHSPLGGVPLAADLGPRAIPLGNNADHQDQTAAGHRVAADLDDPAVVR